MSKLSRVVEENDRILPKLCKSLKRKKRGIYIDSEEVLKQSDLKVAEPPKIAIWEMDTLDAAKKIQEELKLNSLLVLNMCSDRVPGGGYRKGAMAQEESIFYRTTASLDFVEFEGKYPLPPLSAIYTPEIWVIRDSEKMSLLSDRKMFSIDLISMAAPRNSKKSPTSAEELERHIDRLLSLCFQLGYENLLLSAWGCGAFGQDPKVVSSLFKKIIPKYNFKNVFFAILGSNFKVFERMLI